ncbi:hypothetical protein [Nocardioides sp. SR21]|uniref:hypothetical protein n=1 Tax=Nocardioides sp. SR21 TaxID=2919501 RepID=UPI001FAA432C|nr:hypothetical protein [Nocardioides sp. SR21]
MWAKTMVAASAMTAAATTAAGCRSDVDLSGDPNGQEACDQLVVALESSDDVAANFEALTLAAKAAADAETTAIKAAVNEPIEGLDDVPTVDIEKLSAACEDAGVEIPE